MYILYHSYAGLAPPGGRIVLGNGSISSIRMVRLDPDRSRITQDKMPAAIHNNTTDVLVIGAGPAGLMAALVLMKMNMKVRIIDRRLPNEESGQADGIQPRMHEIWESFGIAEALRQQSEHVHRIVTYKPNEHNDGIEQRTQALNIPVPNARYQYEILARIDIIEGILQEQLIKGGVSTDYPVIPSAMDVSESSSDPYPVKITVSWLDEEILRERKLSQEMRSDPVLIRGAVKKTECISAKFVIGCDGGKSWTRKQLNIAMEGEQTDLDWGVIDFTPITNFPTPRAKNIIQSPTAGALGYLPRPNGAARVYVMLGEGQPEKSQDPNKLDTITKVLQKGFAPYKMEIHDPTWCTIFRASQRVAERFSGYGRVFIAGDACHTHSPKAGQGANTSMSDTFNMAWKIGYVLKGWAKQDILATYEEERKPISKELIELDRKIFKLFAGQTVTPEEYTNLWKREIMFASGIGLRYSSSLIDASGHSHAGELGIGERLPSVQVVRCDDWRPFDLHDLAPFNGKFRLFVLPGDISSAPGVSALQDFSNKLTAVLKRFPLLRHIIQIYILIDNEAAFSIETLGLPLMLVEGRYERVFFARLSDKQGMYQKFGLGKAAIVIRPDNHIASVASLDEKGVKQIESYFLKILVQSSPSA